MVMSLSPPVCLGCVVQSMETIADNIREVQPTILFAVPTLYKRVYDKMTAKVRPSIHGPCACT